MKNLLKILKIAQSIILSIIITLVPLSTGVSATNSFYSSNDILFYDENANVAPCANSSSSSNTSTTTPDERLETLLKYFTNKGLSLAAAAGIAGNIKNESGYNPAKIESTTTQATSDYMPVNGKGFGLAQWTYSDRQKPLVDFAKKQGVSIIDMNMQLDYMWQELTTSYVSTLNRLNSISSSTTIGSASAPMAAAIIFHGKNESIKSTIADGTAPQVIKDVNPDYGYEGSADTATRVANTRGGDAEAIYNTYKGIIADGTGVSDQNVLSPINNTPSLDNCYDYSNDSPTNPVTTPGSTTTSGNGWSLSDNTSYINTPCAAGSTDNGTYKHPTHGFIIRLCRTAVGQVNSLISQRVIEIINAAKKDGINLTGDSFRTYEAQLALRKERCADPYNTPAAQCSIQTAKAGTSEHERGLAIDFNSVGKVGSGSVWNWLVANANKYGLYNLAAEGWHWSTSGH
jgi:hypothetical protein